MSDLIWWTLFVILLFVLLILTTKLVMTLFFDCCCVLAPVDNEFDDLTSYTNYFPPILSNVQIKNEINEDEISKRLLLPKLPDLREGNSNTTEVTANTIEEKPNITEDDEIDINVIEDVISIDSADFLDVDLASHASSDSFEKISERDTFATEEDKEIYDQIQLIRGEVGIYARKIPFFLGGNRDLQYFEMNEKFILSMMDLGRINCHDNKDLYRAKNDAMMFFKECQEKLRTQAEKVKT